MQKIHRLTEENRNSGWTPFNDWAKSIGISRTTAWRWQVAGLIHPINILGRNYLSDVEIERFTRRANAGEFASGSQPEIANTTGGYGNMPQHLAEARGLISSEHSRNNTRDGNGECH
jgi:hypothetical protein